ncbi:helix-turn-helix transcriptional regulator [Caulobacter segnis]|uniref:AraC family transcriptional regulator n=1 Tax=Caulobacter segnis TaxID=88688 RepID=UPI00240F5CB5|nr:helix-turn-helix transcriptional regulator [Caulobacter segnis]MDG2523009.1 helix-turn-helix transcriptional regulator [Caulobacter segnis]
MSGFELAPVLAFEDGLPARHVGPSQTHDCGRLILALEGVMTVSAEEASCLLPPHRAAWIPAGVPHDISTREKVRFQTLSLKLGLDRLPATTRVFEVSPLVRALIGEVVCFTVRHEFGAREAALTELLVGEMERMPRVGATTSLPADRRLRRVCEAIIADPSDNRPIDDWALLAGMGRRTFTRTFRTDMGMSLAAWRRQVRVMEAASRIAAGETINVVAYEVGYESPSAFIAMFHRVLGAPPAAYCRELRAAG